MKTLPEVANVISKYLKLSGYNVAYLDYSMFIQEFLGWYRGVNKWHNYNVFNGDNYIQCQRASLNMAKTVCEDMASLLLNEKCKIHLTDEKAQEYIEKILAENNFKECSNQSIELMEALGTGAWVNGWVEENGKLKQTIDYIHGDMVFPLKWDNGIITECAFAKIGGDNKNTKYTIIIHTKENGKYVIKTVEVDQKGSVVMPYSMAKGLNAKQEEAVKTIKTESERPLFHIIKTNIVNNYDKTNPLGMSVFGNAIDVLKSIDVIYDSWRNEFVLGKKRIFVKSNLKKVQIDTGNEITNQIDANDVMFYQLDWAGENEDKPPIYEANMSIRAMEHIESLDKQLAVLSRKVGLGDDFYSFDSGKIGRTATEIISINSALFRNVKKQEIILERAIKELVRAILFIGNKFGNNFDTEQEITIDFDDSIIEDSEKKRTQAMAEFNAGLIDQVEYFAITRNMSREQALEFVGKMKATDTMKAVDNIMNGFGEF